MTKLQYLAYKERVELFLASIEAKPGLCSPVNHNDEPSFSWSPCDCCDDELGGNREHYRFATQKGFTEAFICPNCVYFLTYDKLDDQIMMEIEDSKE